MLRATIEIVPFGIETKAKHIVTFEMSRTTLNNDPEDYNVSVYKDDGELVDRYQVGGHLYRAGAAALTRMAIKKLQHRQAYGLQSEVKGATFRF